MTGVTRKNGDGCSCHGLTPTVEVTVTLDGPSELLVNQTSNFFVTIQGGSALRGGTFSFPFAYTALSVRGTVTQYANGNNSGDQRNFVLDKKVTVKSSTSEIPDQFSLLLNYPNPFNPTMTIDFSLPSSQSVTLVVYDLKGTTVATLIHQTLSAGRHVVPFDASNLAGGMYLYRLMGESGIQQKRMILLK